MNSIVFIHKIEKWVGSLSCLGIVLYGLLTISHDFNDTSFSIFLTTTIFYYSTFLTYLIYIASKRNAEYQHHKTFGSYVPSKSFENEIRRIELFRGMSVERWSVMYTRKKKYAERLLDQIKDAKYQYTLDYNYKEDCYEYSVLVNEVLVAGKTGSRVMAICIIYVELFERK